MEENTIIEEGMDVVETATEGLGNPELDVLDDLPTIVEESGNGDIPVLPVAIGVAVGGAIVLGVKKLYKMIKTRKEAKYLTPEPKADEVEDMEETKDEDVNEEE